MGHCKSFAMGLCDPDIGAHFTGVLDAPTPNYATDSWSGTPLLRGTKSYKGIVRWTHGHDGYKRTSHMRLGLLPLAYGSTNALVGLSACVCYVRATRYGIALWLILLVGRVSVHDAHTAR